MSSSKQGKSTPNPATHYSIITNLFEGQLTYNTLCMHCDHQTHSNQVFTILSLPIPSGNFKCPLQVRLIPCINILSGVV